MKKSLGWICCLLMIIMICGSTVSADDSVRIDFDMLPTTDTWVDGELRIDEYHYYPMELTGTGKLNVRAQTFFDYFRVDILDEDLVSFATEQYINGTAGDPKTVDFEFYLEKGVYYIRCTGEAQREGAYRLKANFEEIESTEEEPNNDYQSAQIIQEGEEIKGIQTKNDEHDFYQFVVDKKKDVKLTVSVEDSSKTHLKLYNEDLILLDEVYDGVAFAEKKTYVYEKTLDAGTYYIDMTTIYTETGCGPYQLRLGERLQKDQAQEIEEES